MTQAPYNILAIFDNWLILEGKVNALKALSPQPLITHVFNAQGTQTGNRSVGLKLLFREDSFDPTTRIKRGRFYEILDDSVGVSGFRIYGVPSLLEGMVVDKRNLNWNKFCFYKNLHLNSGTNNRLVRLGNKDFNTQWRIVDSEVLFNEEIFFTLKAISPLGTLPELIEKKLPEGKKKEIREGFEKVVDVAPIQIAESVVDVCREFARVLLAAWLPTVDVTDAEGDLGNLASKIPKDRVGIANAALVINRLHPRGKSSERERQAGRGQEIRSLSNEDAALAVSLVGFLLRDFGWAA